MLGSPDKLGGDVLVGFRGRNYAGRFDVGLFGKPRFGYFFTTPFRGYNWGFGDQAIPFVLPTDLFNPSYYFLGRGVSAARKDARSKLFVYAGATSTGFALPFLNVARTETPTGLVFYERQLSPALRFTSRNVLSRRQTSIQALEWTVERDMKLGMSAGIGNNQHYWASSFSFNRKVVSLQASYTRAGDAFRRISVEAPAVAETDRENIRLELAPRSNLHFTLGRQNYLAPAASSTGDLRAAVNSFGVSGSAARFQMYGSLFSSETGAGTARAVSMGVRRHVTERVEAGIDYLRSTLPNGSVIHTEVSTFRENVSQRFSLSQVITHGSGQTSIAFGGTFLSNLLTASAEYQTVYLPFAPTGQSQFRQVLVLNLHLQLPHAIQLNGGTNVTSLGHARYTAYATTFAYPGLSPEIGKPSQSGGFYENLVRGRVIEENGPPVAGAALRIDGELVFSDSGGAFFLRRKKAKLYQLEVLPNQFMLPGRFEVVSAPEVVRAEREQMAEIYEVVVRRLPTSPPSNPGLPSQSAGTKRDQSPDLEQIVIPPMPLSILNSVTYQLDASSRSLPESHLKVQTGNAAEDPSLLEQIVIPPMPLSILNSVTYQLDASSRPQLESRLKVAQTGNAEEDPSVHAGERGSGENLCHGCVEGTGAGQFSRGTGGADGTTARDQGTHANCSSGAATRSVVRRRHPRSGTSRVAVCIRPSNRAAIRRRRPGTPRKEVPLSPCQDTTSSPARVGAKWLP